MKILWIEDQHSDKKEIYFQPILSGEKHITIEEVTDFTKGCEIIKSNSIEYDWFILDINLTDSEITPLVLKYCDQFSIDSNSFLQKAGLRLYLELAKLGIPEERIIFLTGNTEGDQSISFWAERIKNYWRNKDETLLKYALEKFYIMIGETKGELFFQKWDEVIDANSLSPVREFLEEHNSEKPKNTFEEFRNSVKYSLIDPPFAFCKDPLDEFNYWQQATLIEKRHKYLSLRRGIIDGCNFLKNNYQTEHISLRKKKSEYSNTNPDSRAEIFSPYDVQGYLDLLIEILPIVEPDKPDKINKYLQLFLRSLCQPWDKLNPNEIDAESAIRQFAIISKQARNYLAHNDLKNIDYEDVAFIFLTNMRVIFELDNKPLAYEKSLLDLFDNHLSRSDWKEIKKQSDKSILMDKYTKAFRKILDDSKRESGQIYFDQKISKIIAKHNPHIKENEVTPNIKYVYLIFWENFVRSSFKKIDHQDLKENEITTFLLHQRKVNLDGQFDSELALACFNYSFSFF